MAISPVAARAVTPVGILVEKLDRVLRTLQASQDVTAAVQEARDLAAGLDPYLAACTSGESAALRLLAERTRAENWSASHDPTRPLLEHEMLSGHVEGQLLKFLVYASRATRVLEIGMFTGYSALAMAEALPAEGVVVACEIDAQVAEFARGCFEQSPSGHKIDVRVAPALVTLAELAASGAVFDLVFIDADKPGYGAYLQALLAGDLLGPDGVICIDNTLLQGQPYLPGPPSENGAAIAAFNRALAADPRVEQVLLPLRDGVTLVRRAAADSR